MYGINTLAVLILLLLYSNQLFFGAPAIADWSNSIFDPPPILTYGWLPLALSMIVTLAEGLIIYKIGSDYFDCTGREHLHVIVWILLVGGLSFLHPMSSMHVATFLIIMAYYITLRTHSKVSDYSGIFRSAMYISVAAFFYDYAAYMIIPHIISLYRFKVADLRDWIVSIAAFITPFYIAAFIFYFIDGNWLFPVETIANSICPRDFAIKISGLTAPQYTLCAIVTALLIIEKIIPTKRNVRGANQQTLQYMNLFSVLMWIAALVFILCAPESKYMLHIIAINATIRIRMLFLKINKKVIANILFLILFVAAVISGIWG
jgi:hypothetical protein